MDAGVDEGAVLAVEEPDVIDEDVHLVDGGAAVVEARLAERADPIDARHPGVVDVVQDLAPGLAPLPVEACRPTAGRPRRRPADR